MEKKSRRNFFIKLFGGIGTLLLGTWIFRRTLIKNLFFSGNFNAELLNNAPNGIDDYCVLTSKQAEGPFFFPSPVRKDIREDRKGLQLSLKFQILRHPDCTPIKNAAVEIWHCDAEGTYSGYPEEITHDLWKTAMFVNSNGVDKNGEIHVDPVNDNRFLRGQQRSDNDGWVEFETIFPGWYNGRVPHIHAKVTVENTEELLTQFYFDTKLCDEIYTTQAPYDTYGKCPMPIEKDIVLSDNPDANGLLLHILHNNDAYNSLHSSVIIGMKLG